MSEPELHEIERVFVCVEARRNEAGQQHEEEVQNSKEE
jgi:hypothetical protein